MNHEQMRNEICSSLLRARRAMMKQSERMRALSEGRPDPHPELDWEFADEIAHEHEKAKSETP